MTNLRNRVRNPKARHLRLEQHLWPNRETGWMADAACNGRDPELWYPVSAIQPTTAYAICQSCPVWRDCARYAWDNGIVDGIWGGMNPTERYTYFKFGKLPNRWNPIVIAMIVESAAYRRHLAELGISPK